MDNEKLTTRVLVILLSVIVGVALARFFLPKAKGPEVKVVEKTVTILGEEKRCTEAGGQFLIEQERVYDDSKSNGFRYWDAVTHMRCIKHFPVPESETVFDYELEQETNVATKS